MNLTAIAIGCCLLAQVPAEQDRYPAKVRPRQPAAKIEEPVADNRSPEA